MAQDAGQSRPVHLSDAQVKGFAAGQGSLGEPTRPRAVTERHVEALRKGEAIDLEKLPVIEPAARAEEVLAEVAGSRPKAVTDADVGSLAKGKDVGLAKREMIERQ